MAKWEAINADILDWAAAYDGPKFHALLCDPPYHLTSITKRFGKAGSKPAQFGRDGAFARTGAGFMGQRWDGGDIAFQPETWAALAAHLYPGAFVMAFAASRGWHRMAVAIEDAGLIIHPSVFMLGWAYGSGFPKATRIDTQVDRAAGAKRETVGNYGRSFRPHADNGNEGWQRPSHEIDGNVTTPATPLAQAWQGHRYGLQALKPALEPIIIAQKPYDGRPVDDITATGAGALWVDGGRIGTSEDTERHNNTMGYHGNIAPFKSGGNSAGRWPSNLILQHTPECRKVGQQRVKGDSGYTDGDKPSHGTSMFGGGKITSRYSDSDGYETVDEWQCADGCPVKRLGEQSGETSVTGNRSQQSQEATVDGTSWLSDNHKSTEYAGDSGTAARFFHQSDFAYEVLEQLANADPVYYTAKASKRERNAGLDSLPLRTRNRVNPGGLENEPRWAPTQAKNIHPTVKPISLTKYLATLLLPPAEYNPRRILIPFSGSGSEMIGALLAGWDEIIGVEQSPEYWQISQARLAWWSQWPGWGQTDVEAILAAAGEEAKETAAVEQLGLF